tara:strand:- start:23614 stop:24102 length:489 start_codon:yes stop_codon:yes gene_type:complete
MRQTAEQRPCGAHLALGQHQHDGASLAVTHRMQLRVQAALGAPDTSGKPPPLLRGLPPSGRLEVRGIDHDPVGLSCLACQFGKYAIEHAQSAPADKAVVSRLVRFVGPGSIVPPQTVLGNIDDTRHKLHLLMPPLNQISTHHASRLIGPDLKYYGKRRNKTS